MLLVDWEGNGNICKPYVSIYESLDRDAKKKNTGDMYNTIQGNTKLKGSVLLSDPATYMIR